MLQTRRDRSGRIHRQPEEKNPGAPARNLSGILFVWHLRERRSREQRSETVEIRKLFIRVAGQNVLTRRVRNLDAVERQVGKSEIGQEQVISQIPLSVHAFYRNGFDGSFDVDRYVVV